MPGGGVPNSCHTNRKRTLKTDSLLPTGRSGEKKKALCFARFVFLTFRGPLASHDSNPYPKRSRIARYMPLRPCADSP